VLCLFATVRLRAPCRVVSRFADELWRVLFVHCEAAEEGTRTIVAECLGKLACIEPARLLPLLAERVSAGAPPFARCTAMAAFKFLSAAPGTTAALDESLGALCPQLFVLVNDADPDVRRVTLAAFNSMAHNKVAQHKLFCC
jgi:cullin-associated NEDD8-dissociated protein 1